MESLHSKEYGSLVINTVRYLLKALGVFSVEVTVRGGDNFTSEDPYAVADWNLFGSTGFSFGYFCTLFLAD